MKRLYLYTLCFLIGLLCMSTLCAPWIAPFEPDAIDLTAKLSTPNSTHWLGTDQLGRDVFSRLLYGGRISLGLSLCIVAVTMGLGLVIGLLGGMAGGRLGKVIARLIDMWLSFPDMVLAIALLGLLGASIENLFLSLVCIKWAEYARITYALVSTIQEREFIRFAYMSGASKMQVLREYVAPNVVSPIIIVGVQHIGDIILTIAGFSVIGIGVQPPTPEWGTILLGAKDYFQTASWLLMYPGLAIFMAVILFNLLGDCVRDLLDPREV